MESLTKPIYSLNAAIEAAPPEAARFSVVADEVGN